MQKIALGALALACIGAPVRGQTPARAMGSADSSLVSKNIYARLFQGIQLTPQRHQKALQLIRGAFLRMLKMQTQTKSGWERFVAVQARRDSALSQLILSPKQRALFWKRAAAARPHSPLFGGSGSSASVRRAPTTTKVGVTVPGDSPCADASTERASVRRPGLRAEHVGDPPRAPSGRAGTGNPVRRT